MLQSKRHSLSELQSLLKNVIVDPYGVAQALKSIDQNADLFVDSNRVAAETRLSVYAEAYFSRIVEALENDFAATAKIVGPEAFHQLVADYLIDYPSSNFNIGEVGRNLPKFVKTHPYADEIEYLSDVVSLEWIAIESFYSETPAPFDFLTLTSLTEAQWAKAKFHFHPSLRFFKSDWALGELFENRNEAPAHFDEIERKIHKTKTTLAVWCIDGQMLVRALANSEFEAISVLQTQHKLDALNSLVGEEPNLALNLSNWFSEWTHLNLISKIEIAD